jgi:hypothetical protein
MKYEIFKADQPGISVIYCEIPEDQIGWRQFDHLLSILARQFSLNPYYTVVLHHSPAAPLGNPNEVAKEFWRLGNLGSDYIQVHANVAIALWLRCEGGTKGFIENDAEGSNPILPSG